MSMMMWRTLCLHRDGNDRLDGLCQVLSETQPAFSQAWIARIDSAVELDELLDGTVDPIAFESALMHAAKRGDAMSVRIVLERARATHVPVLSECAAQKALWLAAHAFCEGGTQALLDAHACLDAASLSDLALAVSQKAY